MESLCVIAEEKVWCIRLDLRILNHEGNVADACSVAGLAALCHFRRPEVSLKGDQITVRVLLRYTLTNIAYKIGAELLIKFELNRYFLAICRKLIL